MQPGSRPSGRERPIRVADVEGSSPASTILDSGIEGKAVLPIWSSRIRHQPGMEGTAAWESAPAQRMPFLLPVARGGLATRIIHVE